MSNVAEQSKLSTPRNFTPGPTPQEQNKIRKDGLDVIHDIYTYAKTGFQSIKSEDADLFKWYGVYLQRPKEAGYFMMRTKIPGGQLTSAQATVIADLIDQYARGFGDITTRQTIQLHWLRIEDFPDIFSRFSAVNMTTSGACGDDTRNIVGCPVAGIDKDEILDATPFLDEVSRHLTDNREFSNLPRKYKISISGCCIQCAQPDINCVGFFAAKRVVNGKEEVGFGVKVGGGLSSSPHLAKVLPAWIKPEQVLPVAHHISVVFRDFGYREKRNRARLKFLMADWGPERYLEAVEKGLGYQLERYNNFEMPDDAESDHFGVQEQKQPGMWYIGVNFLGGRITGQQLRDCARIAEKYGNGTIRNTNKQNLLIPFIRTANLDAVKKELTAAGLAWQASNFRKGCVSCTGIEFCNLAVAETKNRMISLVDQLELASKYQGKVRVHFSGCPSSCGQHQIADIGFRGAQTKVEGKMVDAFDMFVGGGLGKESEFNFLLKGKILSKDVHRVITNLLNYYETNKNNGETFKKFVRRVSKEDLIKSLGLSA